MSILARIMTLLGLILIVVAAVLLGKAVIDINQLHAVASSNRSNNFASPVYNVIWTAGIALVGGLLAGLGLGLSRRRAPVLHSQGQHNQDLPGQK
ncbi:hypothetical protein [Deinococcus altitudinis]|uniref:hypothetical protein n=1 Tax=Deinococcus altitudinis TaxID=468914 RepID=UPI00389287F0